MRYFSNIITLSVVRNYLFVPLKRNFLSSAFECNDSWNKRLSDPLLSKADSESLYYELMNVYNRTKNVNPIDVDIFVNIQTDDSFLTEVEELVHKLRLTAETSNTLPTTHHGFIRLFSHYNAENLMRILNDRLNYGIFPDYYCSIYLINKFLKENDFRNAAKVAALRMLQEDFSNNLLKYMSLYSVLRYLNTKEPWENNTSTDTESADNEDEEEVKVKVKFLRNPFFDDHFDLTDGQQICGKTLLLISLTMENAMKNSLKIMGLALYNKWHLLEEELMKLLENQKEVSIPLIYKDSLKFTEDVVSSKLEDPSKLNNIISYLKAIDPQHCIDEKLIECVEKDLKEEIRVSENVIIQLQEERYKEWGILREEKLQQFLDDMNKRQRLENINRKKEEMKMKEELLYFFDNEDEIDLTIQKKSVLIWKRSFDQAERKEQEKYLPPEIHELIKKNAKERKQ